jgi:hypothetical protein
VSKRWDRLYQAGPSKHWIKVKNRQHPAMERVMDDLVWIMARQPGDGAAKLDQTLTTSFMKPAH